MEPTDNPYTPPTSDLTDDIVYSPEEMLASRWKRLGAILLDLLILLGSQLLIVLVIGFFTETNLVDAFLSQDPVPMFATNLTNMGWYIGLVFDSAFFFIINGYLLTTRGQTIGKVITRIAIVKAETLRPLPIGRLVLLRYAPIYAFQAVMYVAYSIVFLVDALFIFRRDRRTLHDLIAGTAVIDLRLQERLRAEGQVDENAGSNPSNLEDL